ncbi:MAG TPA: hypothetical protein VJI68_03375 [Candidatus Nanoarchaeia archaeon]|nr:hypothetical protein [Candidatus Nanoarchaeia archaeon]
MVKIGDVAVKTAGRDSGQLCVVVDNIDANYVMIDGLTRRKKCNVFHLEFIGQVKVKKGANASEVRNALKDAGFKFKEPKKGKPKEKKTKPVPLRKSTSKEVKTEEVKKATKKPAKKSSEK